MVVVSEIGQSGWGTVGRLSEVVLKLVAEVQPLPTCGYKPEMGSAGCLVSSIWGTVMVRPLYWVLLKSYCQLDLSSALSWNDLVWAALSCLVVTQLSWELLEELI